MAVVSPLISLIVHNARIWDGKKKNLSDTAVAISRDTIVAVGKDSEILKLTSSGTEVIDAGGRWLLPGFLDSHTHFLGYVNRKRTVDLSACQSLSEALAVIRRKVEATPEGEWITGGGWDKNVWGLPDFPHRRDLDEISTQHFIALDSKDWHSLWVNSPALSLSGIDSATASPEGGRIVKDERTREPTGILQEMARKIVFDRIPVSTYGQLKAEMRKATHEFYRYGLTGFHSMETPTEFSVYQEALRQGKLGLRVFWYLPVDHLAAAQALAIQSGLGNEFLKISGMKIFLDGALGSQSAEMLQPYEGLSHSGIEVLSEADLYDLVHRAVEARLPCAIHAIGDAANRKAIRVLGRLQRTSREHGLQHRIEHAQLLHPDDLPLLGKYGITASVQPRHLSSDIPLIEKYWGKRGRYAYAFNSIRKSGARLIFGSDTPIESFNPWYAIYSAMERKFNLEDSEPSFYSEEKLRLNTCLQAYTSNSAAAVGMEHRLGGIAPGMTADFFLVNRDIFRVPTTELKEAGSVFTVFNGQIVYREF